MYTNVFLDFQPRTSASREVGGWGRVPLERWGAGVEYHFQEFNEPYAPS